MLRSYVTDETTDKKLNELRFLMHISERSEVLRTLIKERYDWYIQQGQAKEIKTQEGENPTKSTS